MGRLSRTLTGLLAAWLTVQPVIAAGATARRFDEVYTRYLRGEATFGELQDARRSFQEEQISRARASAEASPVAPSAGPAAPGAEEPPAEEPSLLGKVASWIRDIPKRTFRRWAPEDDGFRTPEEAQEFIENSPVPAYTANAIQREADSDWTRPVRVTAQAEINKVQGVIERVIAVGGLATLTKALKGEKAALATVAKAKAVVGRLGAAEQKQLLGGLTKGPLGKKILNALHGKPTSTFGRIVKDGFGNNILLAIAASGLVSAFLNDGLDLDTLKDNLVALNAVQLQRTRREELLMQPLEAIAYYHMDRGASSLFTRLWDKLYSGSGAAGAWVRAAEQNVSRLGKVMVKDIPEHLVPRSQQLARTAGSLGLPGVTGATQLTLRGLAESGFKSGLLGLVGMPVIYSGWKLIAGQEEGVYIGGDRDRIFARYDLFDTYFQRTGNKWKDMIEERKVAEANLLEGYLKWPAYNALDYFFRFLGGYVGAVVASSLIAPTGILGFGATLVVSAIFSEGGVALGRWLGAKLDTSPRFYRKLRGKNMETIFRDGLAMDLALPERREAMAALLELDRLRSAVGVRTPEDVELLEAQGGPEIADLERLAAAYARKKQAYLHALGELASSRADDYEKLMKVSQVNRRIHFVEDFSEVRLVQNGDYVDLVIGDWSAHASPRYDILTADGRRGVWDYKTNRILDVGRVAENNGKRIAFLDDSGVTVTEDGVLRTPDADLQTSTGDAFLSKEGIIFEKSPSEEWLVRGYGGEYDIVLRSSGRRFAWDGEAFREVRPGEGVGVAQEHDGKTEDFIQETIGDLTASVSSKGRSGALEGALRDLSGVHRAGRGSLAERFATALGVSR